MKQNLSIIIGVTGCLIIAFVGYFWATSLINSVYHYRSALRFTPPETAEPKQEGGFVSRLLPSPPAEPKNRNGSTVTGSPQVWILDDHQQPKALPVEIGESNGRLTEIIAGDLKPDMAVITDYQEAKP